MDPRDIGRADVLILVDVQNDFLPGGRLAVPEGNAVIPVLNRWMKAAVATGASIVWSRDWHPREHVSFEARGGKWPPHCVQNTKGAAFHADLDEPQLILLVSKGQFPDEDQYSAFHDTGLDAELRQRGAQRVFVGGLAQDVCVRRTVLDGLKEGFRVHLISDATRPVDPEEGKKAIEEMRENGAQIEETA